MVPYNVTGFCNELSTHRLSPLKKRYLGKKKGKKILRVQEERGELCSEELEEDNGEREGVKPQSPGLTGGLLIGGKLY